MASNLSFGSGAVVSISVQAHLTRVGTLSGPGIHPYPASYPARSAEGPTNNCPGFLLPFGRRHSLLGSSFARQGIRPSSRSADRIRTRIRIRTLAGFPRSAHTSHDRNGCLLYPEGGGAHSADKKSPTDACRSSTASPYTPLRTTHQQGSRITRHQRRFTRFTRPALPSPVAPGWNEDPRA